MSGASTVRLFFAAWPPRETAAALHAWAQALAPETGGRHSRPDHLHLTLAFLGEVPVARVVDAVAVAKRAQAKARPHDVPIEQAVVWPQNQVFWVGPLEAPAPLAELVTDLQAGLRAEGFFLEQRPFAAHVTLARKARAPKVFPALPAVAWPVREFTLVRSVPGPKEAEYEVVERFPLPAGA